MSLPLQHWCVRGDSMDPTLLCAKGWARTRPRIESHKEKCLWPCLVFTTFQLPRMGSLMDGREIGTDVRACVRARVLRVLDSLSRYVNVAELNLNHLAEILSDNAT